MVAHAVMNSSDVLATFCTLAIPPPAKLPLRLPAIICLMHAPKQSTSQFKISDIALPLPFETPISKHTI
jgi:hypothetical protein